MGGLSNLEALVQSHLAEWVCLEHRLERDGIYPAKQPAHAQPSSRNSGNASTTLFVAGQAGAGLLRDFLQLDGAGPTVCAQAQGLEWVWQVRMWASLRTATAARSIRGALTYVMALRARLA